MPNFRLNICLFRTEINSSTFFILSFDLKTDVHTHSGDLEQGYWNWPYSATTIKYEVLKQHLVVCQINQVNRQQHFSETNICVKSRRIEQFIRHISHLSHSWTDIPGIIFKKFLFCPHTKLWLGTVPKETKRGKKKKQLVELLPLAGALLFITLRLSQHSIPVHLFY